MKEQQHDDVLLRELKELRDDVPPMPEGFHEAWMQRIEEDDPMMREKEERNRTNQPNRWNSLKRWVAAAAAVVFVVGGTLLTRDDLLSSKPASSAAQNGSARSPRMETYSGDMIYGSYDEVADYDSGAGYNTSNLMMAKGASVTEDAAARESKIIRTASLNIATKQYDESLALLKRLCEEAGGWVSWTSENTSGTGLRSANLTLRIPSDKLDSFLEGTGGVGRVTYRSETADDVTDSYYDTATRLATQQALMNRLQTLVTDAASLSDLLALESQIADTQYEIDRLTGSLQSTDKQVDYATVDISLREERAAEDLTNDEMSFGERLLSALQVGLKAFAGFIGDAVVFLMAALPFLAVVIVVVIVWKVVRKAKKNRK